MSIITRFAPSPTGLLHLGGARTALFNWLYARRHAGKFRLRIEDTDQARSIPQAAQSILDDLKWLGLSWDDEVVYQSARIDRHREVALCLLETGHAYRCYATPEELELLRAHKKGYDRRWRDRPPSQAPSHIQPVIRLKAPLDGISVIEDQVQGRVQVKNTQLDDFILLRADRTPTYMLSVVVDDHDMGITHVIRGDDHLNNAFRQAQLFQALGWNLPVFAHIPLIHSADGKKLSKRQGALDVGTLRDEGYLAEAVCNYLLRLGWSHGNDEIIDRQQAIEWFGLEGIGRSPARFNRDKLVNLNRHYIRNMSHGQLAERIKDLSKPPSPVILRKVISECNASVQSLSEVSPEDQAKWGLLESFKQLDFFGSLGNPEKWLEENPRIMLRLRSGYRKRFDLFIRLRNLEKRLGDLEKWSEFMPNELRDQISGIRKTILAAFDLENWTSNEFEVISNEFVEKLECMVRQLEQRVKQVMLGLTSRVSTLRELVDGLGIYSEKLPLSYDEKSKLLIRQAPELLVRTHKVLTDLSDNDWLKEPIEQAVRTWAEQAKQPMKSVAQTMRAALTGRLVSPPIFEVAEILGRDRTLYRLDQETLASVIAQ